MKKIELFYEVVLFCQQPEKVISGVGDSITQQVYYRVFYNTIGCYRLL